MILRELIAFEDQGADAFFGEPEFDTARPAAHDTPTAAGLISLVELPNLQDRPAVFSTFLMWLLADLFHDLPELGDPEKPSLVFFFDEAHLLFADASKDFLQAITQTVRLIRSKGVGVFFVTQSPTDVPDEILAQLGSRVQHQLRAATPNDAKALKATVNTYPTSSYDDLGKVILSLGIGEAVVTVMNERGAPTPVAWTRLRAPESLMGPADPAAMTAAVEAVRAAGEVRRGDRPRVGPGEARGEAGRRREAGRAGGASRRRARRLPRPVEAEGAEAGEPAAADGRAAGRARLAAGQAADADGHPRDRARCVRRRTPAPLARSRPGVDPQTHQRTASTLKSAGACTPTRSGRSRSSAVRSRVRAAARRCCALAARSARTRSMSVTPAVRCGAVASNGRVSLCMAVMWCPQVRRRRRPQVAPAMLPVRYFV